MKLTTEEISNLRKQLQSLKKSLDNYIDYMKSREVKRGTGDEFNQVGDTLTEHQYQREFRNYNVIKETLESAEYVRDVPTEEIGIGTKFIVQFDDDEEEKEIILTEGGVGITSLMSLVSVESPFGKHVIGKKAGDTFEYTVDNTRTHLNRRPIRGVIKEIYTDPKCYLHFIRERKTNHRMSRAAIKENMGLYKSTNSEDKEKYAEALAITESQVALLDIEEKRLSKKKRNPNENARLTKVKTLLRTAKRVTPPTDGTIGIGSRFEIVIMDGDELKKAEYEMINRAVSDELEDAYIEKISPIGTSLFGLKENDSFKFIKDFKHYKGIVTKVEKEKTSTDFQSYQYQKK